MMPLAAFYQAIAPGLIGGAVVMGMICLLIQWALKWDENEFYHDEDEDDEDDEDH